MTRKLKKWKRKLSPMTNNIPEPTPEQEKGHERLVAERKRMCAEILKEAKEKEKLKHDSKNSTSKKVR